jgi:3'-phosphoadenosine 5'-phosphosulfate sulfotransferase (PAPS reductase)/FAD synthetase
MLSSLKVQNLVLPKSLQAIIDRHNEIEGARDKPVLFVSFSGGRTSAYMSKWLIDNVSHLFELCFTFANTGQEHEKTLDFVHQCDKAINMRLVWVEADVQHGKRVGSKHKIVSYATASRNGEPFEEVIKKYGIPNAAFQHCNREMKLNPLNSYRNVVLENLDPCAFGFAIGIRADEADRMSGHAEKTVLYIH